MRNIDSAEGGESLLISDAQRRKKDLTAFFYEHSFNAKQMKKTIPEIVGKRPACALPVLQLPRACVFCLSFLRQFFRNSLRVYRRSV